MFTWVSKPKIRWSWTCRTIRVNMHLELALSNSLSFLHFPVGANAIGSTDPGYIGILHLGQCVHICGFQSHSFWGGCWVDGRGHYRFKFLDGIHCAQVPVFESCYSFETTTNSGLGCIFLLLEFIRFVEETSCISGKPQLPRKCRYLE